MCFYDDQQKIFQNNPVILLVGTTSFLMNVLGIIQFDFPEREAWGLLFEGQLSLSYNLAVYKINEAKFQRHPQYKIQLISCPMLFDQKILPYHLDSVAFSQTVRLPNNYSQRLDAVLTPKKKAVKPYDPREMEIETDSNEWSYQFENQSIQDEAQENVRYRDKILVQYKNFEHVRINRGRLYDWFVQICRYYEQSWQTLWTSIALMDRIIAEKGKISVGNIHLYGITSFFMASKYNQAQNCLKIQSIYSQICFSKFTKKQILECEQEIFAFLCLSNHCKSMHFPTMEDRVMESFPDLDDEVIKKIMIELFYFWQDPLLVINPIQNWTENQLVVEVGKAVLRNQRFKNCDEVQKFFLDEYGCIKIKMHGKYLKL